MRKASLISRLLDPTGALGEAFVTDVGSLAPNFNDAPHGHPTIIGLSGYAKSGKDEVAKVLHRLYGYERVAFADGIKALVKTIDPLVFRKNGDDIRAAEWVDAVGDVEAKDQDEYRRLLQATGQGARKVFGEEVWINLAMSNLSPLTHYVISDVRLPNEAHAIKDRGGLVLRVERPGVEPVNGHLTEHALDDWDFDAYVYNEGTLIDLEGEVQRALGDLG